MLRASYRSYATPIVKTFKYLQHEGDSQGIWNYPIKNTNKNLLLLLESIKSYNPKIYAKLTKYHMNYNTIKMILESIKKFNEKAQT